MNKQCEMCGEQKEIAGTAFVGQYCIECHKTNIEASLDAIREIKKSVKSTSDKTYIKVRK